jgi:nucleoside-diphosphate-sugar epimerase
MKIAITGGSGDIGGAYLKHAVKRHEINALVRATSSLRKIPKNSIIKTYIFEDITNYETAFLQDFTKADAVVHFAALLNTNQLNLIDYISTNALFTGLLALLSAQNKNTPKFIYISSEMVYQLHNDKKLTSLAKAFVVFCKSALLNNETNLLDLHKLAKEFINEQKEFPFEKYNLYALTKYLGEVIVLSLPQGAVIRISNAYGPGYDNLSLIPKLIVNRLTGYKTKYVKETRDFVYNADIHSLLDTIIECDIVGTIDCKSGEMIKVDDLKDALLHLTPTAYGEYESLPSKSKVNPSSTIPDGEINLIAILGKATPFKQGLLKTLRYHKEKCYHQMEDSTSIDDFILPRESFVKKLRGSSAAYIFVVKDKENNKRVRKVALRDGVEGNGIAKLKNEINYYKYIAKNHRNLAKLYPKLLDGRIDKKFSVETIEYLDGRNFYEELQKGKLTQDTYRETLQKFMSKLNHSIQETYLATDDGENALNVYYLERAINRLQPVYGLVKKQDTIMINDELLLAPHIILSDLLKNKSLRRLITPHVKSFCFHGDMTLLNTVYLEKLNEIRLIDPRGYTGSWDALYDFAKMKFTLSGFGEFIFGEKKLVSDEGENFRINFDQIPANAEYLNQIFFGLLANNKEFSKKVIANEPFWRYRIELAEATHYLADIPFRLFTDEESWTAKAAYIVGTYYLNKVYASLKKKVASDSVSESLYESPAINYDR